MNKNKSLITEDTNFISQVGDIYHLLGALTYAYKISKTEKVKGVVFVGKNWLRNDPIKEQVFETDNIEIRIIKNYKRYIPSFGERFKILRNFYNRAGKTVHLVNVRVPSFNLISYALSNFNKKIKCVVIEEGIATYYNEKGVFFAAKGKIKKILIGMMLFGYEDFTFFQKTGKYKLEENKDVTENYRQFLSYYSNKIYDSIDETKKKYKDRPEGKSAFVASYPILNHHAEYMKFMEQLIEFLKSENIRVFIKPHQCDILEQYNAFGAEVLPHDLPLESLLDYFKPDYLIGLLSTALVNANVLFKTASLDLSNVLQNEYNVSLTPHKDYINSLFGEYVKVINSFSELKEFIKKGQEK